MMRSQGRDNAERLASAKPRGAKPMLSTHPIAVDSRQSPFVGFLNIARGALRVFAGTFFAVAILMKYSGEGGVE